MKSIRQYTKYIIIILVVIVFLIFIKSYASPVSRNVNMDYIDSERFRLLTNNYSDFTHVFLFSRDSCKSCIEAKPIINKVFSELPNSYYINYYDTDKNREQLDFEQILKDFNIDKVPTIIIFNYNENSIKKIDDIKILTDYEQLLYNLTN